MNTQEAPKRVRCAIYTRKSTDEGLDMDFNSLDAQREAAEAYVTSQRSEGWEYLPTHYDDGGFTGGNVDRPALQRLLEDVESGRTDCVVVYKVDRLSRSLLDFSKLMDVFDKHGVSFVSITQQFNTTHSMGRLTLNILLSFAQFEREIIAERTKDKMSAARRKGKWVGGIPVLGYNIAPDGGKLVVNAEEAAQARALFNLYLERESLLEVCEECELRGWHTKAWTSAKGRVRGGKSYTKNDLQRLLRNVTYIGRVEYEGRIYEDEHEAVMDTETWERVQKLMSRNARTGGKEVRNRYSALLRGLLRCVPCDCGMAHTISTKNGKHYRYYVCSNAQKRGRKACPTPSLNAHEIEQAVVEHIRRVGSSPEMVRSVLAKAGEMEARTRTELEAERGMLHKEIDRCNAGIVRGVKNADSSALAELHDRLKRLEQRYAAVLNELEIWEAGRMDPAAIETALRDFSPIWAELTPGEQAKVLQMLLEKFDYDGRDGAVSVRFRSQGLKQLCHYSR
jgi:site-specific DNA recombinase